MSITIREFRDGDVDQVVEFPLPVSWSRVWAPVAVHYYKAPQRARSRAYSGHH